MNIIVGLKGNTLKQVYDYRKPIYARYADVTVTIDGHGVTESVQLILGVWDSEVDYFLLFS